MVRDTLRPRAGGGRETLGRYELITEIAASPLGAHWAARIASGAELGRAVSVRRIPRGGPIDDAAVARISEAAFSAADIRHPKLVAVLEVVVAPQEIAIVSEYVEGTPLRALQRQAALKRAPISIPVALRIVVDLLEAANAARIDWCAMHGSPMDSAAEDERRLSAAVHGGITPHTVLVASFGETMLSDLATAGTAIGIRDFGRHAGLVPYFAPEQTEALPTPATDVFSVGVLLWEMLMNEPLFGSVTGFRGPGPARIAGLRSKSPEIDAVLQKTREHPIARVDLASRPGPPVPKEVADVVARALDRDLDARYQTPTQMIAAMGEFPEVATPEQVGSTVERLLRSELEARRVAIELATGTRVVDSQPPESGRPTYRPPAPVATKSIETSDIPSSIPRASRPTPIVAEPDGLIFGAQEAPTTPSIDVPAGAPSQKEASKDEKPPLAAAAPRDKPPLQKEPEAKKKPQAPKKTAPPRKRGALSPLLLGSEPDAPPLIPAEPVNEAPAPPPPELAQKPEEKPQQKPEQESQAAPRPPKPEATPRPPAPEQKPEATPPPKPEKTLPLAPPLASPSKDVPKAPPQARTSLDAFEASESGALEQRRGASRKVVAIVLGLAGVILLVAGVRASLSKSEDPAAEVSTKIEEAPVLAPAAQTSTNRSETEPQPEAPAPDVAPAETTATNDDEGEGDDDDDVASEARPPKREPEREKVKRGKKRYRPSGI